MTHRCSRWRAKCPRGTWRGWNTSSRTKAVSRRGLPRTSGSRAAPWMKRSPPRETTLCGSAGRGSVPGVEPNIHGGGSAPIGLATTRYRSSLEKNSWRGPRRGPRPPEIPGSCVRSLHATYGIVAGQANVVAERASWNLRVGDSTASVTSVPPGRTAGGPPRSWCRSRGRSSPGCAC